MNTEQSTNDSTILNNSFHLDLDYYLEVPNVHVDRSFSLEMLSKLRFIILDRY